MKFLKSKYSARKFCLRNWKKKWLGKLRGRGAPQRALNAGWLVATIELGRGAHRHRAGHLMDEPQFRRRKNLTPGMVCIKVHCGRDGSVVVVNAPFYHPTDHSRAQKYVKYSEHSVLGKLSLNALMVTMGRYTSINHQSVFLNELVFGINRIQKCKVESSKSMSTSALAVRLCKFGLLCKV